MTEVLLAIAVCAVPVVGIVVLAMSGRVLRKSCAPGPQGDCLQCGRTGRDAPAAGDPDACRTAPPVGSCHGDQAKQR